jgi:hypothetical protein
MDQPKRDRGSFADNIQAVVELLACITHLANRITLLENLLGMLSAIQ